MSGASPINCRRSLKVDGRCDESYLAAFEFHERGSPFCVIGFPRLARAASQEIMRDKR
jgi:hypothetical protein